jgi:hypothetical protein
VFTGTGTYTIGSGQLRVYIDGVRQFPSEYSETTSTSFTLNTGVPAGTKVLAEVDANQNYSVAAVAVTFSPAGTLAATNVQTALEELDTEKAPKASPTFTGTVSGITAAMVGLGNVTNESKATMFTNPTFTTSADGSATFSAFSSSTDLTIGPSTAGSTTISSGTITTGARIINIGIGGSTGSTTDVYIGSGQGPSTTWIQGAVRLNYNSASSSTTIDGPLIVNNTATLKQITEVLNTKTTATGIVTHDFSTGTIFYHTSPSANFTIDFTNVPTTNDRTVVLTVIIVQGATPYISNAIRINGGSNLTIRWLNGIIPTGTANQVDTITFVLTRVSSTWTVLASLSTFN